MQIDTDNMRFLVGDNKLLLQSETTPALPMFSNLVIEFLSDLSRKLLNNKEAKSYVDVIAYAYWIRRASLEKVREKHTDFENRIGRGLAFHIAPSNVPVNFAVSMTSSLLAGNITVIRVSNREFSQVDIICREINALLNTKYDKMKSYICVVRYEHNEDITAEISRACDVRIIWGGNATIEKIRKAPLGSRAIELSFADRHSLAVINADEYLNEDPLEIAKRFYTDTYYTDQNACSSPRLVVWMGKEIEKAQKRFWSSLETKVKNEYEIKPIQVIDKYAMICKLGMANTDVDAHMVIGENYVTRIQVDKLTEELMKYKNGSGYFFEYKAKELSEIIPVLNKSCQTISVLGVDKAEIKKIVFESGVRGVDRIVDMGQTMGLEFVWDGFKMIEAMSRVVYMM